MKGEREEALGHIVHFSCRLLFLNLFPVVNIFIFLIIKQLTPQSNEDGENYDVCFQTSGPVLMIPVACCFGLTT